MPRAVVLIHADNEGPARVAEILNALGHEVDVRPSHRGAEIPTALPRDTPLVVMGGSMGVGDLGREEYPFLAREVALLQRCLADGTPVLGVCLGAQLLAHAAGARVAPMRVLRPEGVHYEVGWGDVVFARAEVAPILEGLPAVAPMLHWHGDTFELPPGALRLASTSGCPEQGFQIGARVFGLQFHPEVGQGDIEAYLAADEAFVVQANGPGGVERIRRDTARYYEEFRAASNRLLGNILGAMTAR